ncbi:MAG: hemerythrin domain-containing protein [Bacteroidales bacterium]|nr:hemerythrin domain-containing protein [Bacteroidales bacterium]
MLINKDMKMVEVIHMNHHLLHVINRFGIQLGFGEKSVEAVCKEHQVDLNFFLDLINTYHNRSYFPLQNLLKIKASMLVDYLHKTHQYYLEFKVPEIESYIDRLLSDNVLEEESKQLLSDFFQQYKAELTQHIQIEETRVYPYAIALEKYLKQKISKEELTGYLKKYSIAEYEEEHGDIEEKLFDLKNIIIKYLPAPRDSRLLNVILHDLFELELDLNNHCHIENMILVPIVEEMEKALSETP